MGNWGRTESLQAYINKARLTACKVGVFLREKSQLSKYAHPLLRSHVVHWPWALMIGVEVDPLHALCQLELRALLSAVFPLVYYHINGRWWLGLFSSPPLTLLSPPFSSFPLLHSLLSSSPPLFPLLHSFPLLLTFPLLPSSLPCSDVLSTIDQTEFEGFEYINPLLMSKVDDVWTLPPVLWATTAFVILVEKQFEHVLCQSSSMMFLFFRMYVAIIMCTCTDLNTVCV